MGEQITVKVHTFKDMLGRNWGLFTEPKTGNLMLDRTSAEGLPLSLNSTPNFNHLQRVLYYSDAYAMIAIATRQPESWVPELITTKEFEL